MFVYTVLEYNDYYDSEIVVVFANEEDAKNYVKENYWDDMEGRDGIFYEKHEVK